LVVEGVGEYQIPMTTVKYAWVLCIPYIYMLVFQSGLSGCPMPRLSLSPHSRVGLDSVRTTTTL